jgi:dTDP-4-amino-4,6-dideoxygalactose transaminase
VLATHLFGQPCPIREIVKLAREKDFLVIEDCAHACGVRVAGQQVGTLGDIGVFSFAEGKNMSCLGGGAIATSNEMIARRAQQIFAKAPAPSKAAVFKAGLAVWFKWLITRPLVFGLTVYPGLRLKQMLGQPLMDSVVGDELLQEFMRSSPQIYRLANLQAAIGERQIQRIDAFNQGARKNAEILTQSLGEVPGIQVPRTTDGNHIYVYYPLKVAPEKRDGLRHYLLKHRIDTKTTDMADCCTLEAFRDQQSTSVRGHRPAAASLLEICVYPVFSRNEMRRIARVIRAWAGIS